MAKVQTTKLTPWKGYCRNLPKALKSPSFIEAFHGNTVGLSNKMWNVRGGSERFPTDLVDDKAKIVQVQATCRLLATKEISPPLSMRVLVLLSEEA